MIKATAEHLMTSGRRYGLSTLAPLKLTLRQISIDRESQNEETGVHNLVKDHLVKDLLVNDFYVKFDSNM